MNKKLFAICIILMFALSACSITINFPEFREVGPMQVDEISSPYPGEDGTPTLSIFFGAGTLKLHPGSEDLISGTASYNIDELKPVVATDGLFTSIEQGDWKLKGIPRVKDIKVEWDLFLGADPMNLNIDAGAYQGEFELGGLALENLTVSDGASDVELNFSESNPVEMDMFRYETGASNVKLLGLANANFSTMDFEGGAGNYTLDFSGTLQREANVSIEAGVSNIALVIPDGLSVQLTMEGGLSNVTYGSGWEKNGSVYTQEGTGPQLTIFVEIGAGNLTLTR